MKLYKFGCLILVKQKESYLFLFELFVNLKHFRIFQNYNLRKKKKRKNKEIHLKKTADSKLQNLFQNRIFRIFI